MEGIEEREKSGKPDKSPKLEKEGESSNRKISGVSKKTANPTGHTSEEAAYRRRPSSNLRSL